MTVTPPVERPCILLVDDEEALVWSVSNRVVKVRPDYTVLPVTDGRAALRVLAARNVDLLITDIRMPEMSGLELIVAARRLHRSLPVIVMTAYPTAELPMDAALRGSIDYLQKPFEFDRFLAMMEEALERKSHGFSGAISVQTLPDIVQLYALSNASGALWVRRRGIEGRVWFEHGTVTHATAGELTGEEAFHTIMLWSGGEFSMMPGEAAPRRSIRATWTELLMESCRRLDDLRRNVEAQGPVSTRGWNVQPLPGPSNSEPPQTEHMVVDMALGDLDAAFSPVTPPVAPVTLSSNEPEPALTEAPAETEAPLTEAPAAATGGAAIARAADSLCRLDELDGFLGAALIDSDTGALIASRSGGEPIDFQGCAESSSALVRTERRLIEKLYLGQRLEDILLSLGQEYHLIRPLRERPSLYFYLTLDRSRANLGLARVRLADVERAMGA